MAFFSKRTHKYMAALTNIQNELDPKLDFKMTCQTWFIYLFYDDWKWVVVVDIGDLVLNFT